MPYLASKAWAWGLTILSPSWSLDAQTGAGYLVFRHAGDANEAFKQLPGAQDTDSFGRAQKQLKLTSGTD